jgi:hypothetical protein
MQLTYTQIQETLAKKPESRYKYFIRTVVTEEEVWGLADDEGWLMLEDDDDDSDVIAVFPNAEFAAIFREKGEFEEFRVEALDLYEFLEWLDDFETEKIKVGVFPTPDFQCAVMTSERLKMDFQVEFDKEKGE